MYLSKIFKFFDIQNRGQVDFDQFKRAITKIGVVVPDDRDTELVFQFYDKSGDGRIDYKEFIAAFKASQDAEWDQPQQVQRAKGNSPPANSAQAELQVMMQLFRDKIKGRGPRGVIGLQRIFAIMDDDKSGALSMGEFEKACRDFKIGISTEFMPTIFDAFDLNHDGTLSTEEFMRAICGEMPPARQQVVQNAFWHLDKNQQGSL